MQENSCEHSKECCYTGKNGSCGIVSGTVLKRLCPFGKKEGSATGKSNAEPQSNC